VKVAHSPNEEPIIIFNPPVFEIFAGVVTHRDPTKKPPRKTGKAQYFILFPTSGYAPL
jgi:hypothetical protein